MPSPEPRSCPSCREPFAELLGDLPDSGWFAGIERDEKMPGGGLYRCARCRLKFRYPVQDLGDYIALYDNSHLLAWDSECTRNDWDLAIGAIREVLPAYARVLDVGCYTGGLLSRLGPWYQRFGIEVNTAAARVAEQAGLMVWSSLDDVPAGTRFDAVIACDVVEHLADPEDFLLKLVSWLAEGGILVVTTGDAENRLWERFGANWWYCYYPEHIAFISRPWLRYLAREHDLRIARCEAFFHMRHPWPLRMLLLAATHWYGRFPRSYLAMARVICKLSGKSEPRSVPGNGASADHLFVMIQRNPGSQVDASRANAATQVES